MKHEWKKEEKQFYLPKDKPELITVPYFKFFTVCGEGNPNDASFAEYVGVLYSLAYSVKMSVKKGIEPEGYFDYAVYPLEGVWGFREGVTKNADGTFDKNNLIFKLMIRQPDFVTGDFAAKMIDRVKKSKPHPLLDKVKFEEIAEGLCIQMLHTGSYDNEPASFALMQEFAAKNNCTRATHIHREIYLGDARKTIPEKLKTVLRFAVCK